MPTRLAAAANAGAPLLEKTVAKLRNGDKQTTALQYKKTRKKSCC